MQEFVAGEAGTLVVGPRLGVVCSFEETSSVQTTYYTKSCSVARGSKRA